MYKNERNVIINEEEYYEGIYESDYEQVDESILKFSKKELMQKIVNKLSTR